MSQTRPHLHRPPYGNITQGTVFCCATAQRYKSCEVHGLAITARCDLAQQKYPVLNYLPVVRLGDWMKRDGLDILIENEYKNQNGQLGSMLRSAKLSPSLLDSVPLEDISNTHFPVDVGSKAQKAAASKFSDLLREIESFTSLIAKNNHDDLFLWFRTHRFKQVEELIKRLSKHSVLGHYLFEEIIPGEDGKDGYICLFREVSTLPRQVSEELGRGLSLNRYEDLCTSSEEAAGLVIKNNELAMPVGLVGSPTIEHVLQSFSTLFGRIGIADPQDEIIGGIINQYLIEESSK